VKLDQPESPDRFERIVRFVCGGLFGLVLGLGLAVGVFEFEDAPEVMSTTIGCALLCAVLAMRFGDRFWYILSNWLRWF
jgi:hypothetical protein